ncbi:MAG: fructosamine kinase family protein [Chloroflexi bacterium]|nr:fructosamine kinase family protein [Chloroflexota bacterium]
MIPHAVRRWLEQQGHGKLTGRQPVGGGCINNGARLETESEISFFLKTNTNAPEDMFAREAEGLAELRKAKGPRVPEPYLWDIEFILLEDLKPAPRAGGYWETLGRQLAQLHQTTKEQFGFVNDNYLGSTPQPNPCTVDGYEFFGEHRLGYQARLARDNELLTRAEAAEIEKLARCLPELVPAQPASLIHGDLWGGNAISDERGQPVIIDPAAHYGWAEAELGMTALFGGFQSAFYTAYTETRPLEPGWRDRLPIYNLYHLLNHLNLFGSGYHGQVMEVLRRYR